MFQSFSIDTTFSVHFQAERVSKSNETWELG
jgi:hypothetical protein